MGVRGWILISLCFFLGGCSWITRFVVQNASATEVKLSYWVPKHLNVGSGESICPIGEGDVPLVMSGTLSDLQRADLWVETPNYHYDPERCSAEFVLRPGEAARVSEEALYTGHDRSLGSDAVGLERLTVRRYDGETTLSGWDLVKSFRKVSVSLYVLEYE